MGELIRDAYDSHYWLGYHDGLEAKAGNRVVDAEYQVNYSDGYDDGVFKRKCDGAPEPGKSEAWHRYLDSSVLNED